MTRQAMKIKVHEIEDNYYCSINDIAKVKATGTKTGLSTALKLFKKMAIFISFEETDSLILDSQNEKLHTKFPLLVTGLVRGEGYRPSKLRFLFLASMVIAPCTTIASAITTDSILYAYFSTGIILFLVFVYRYTIFLNFFSTPKEIYITHICKERILNSNGKGLIRHDAEMLFISLSDAQIYFADVATDVSFTKPNTSPYTDDSIVDFKTKKEERMTIQLLTESETTQSITESEPNQSITESEPTQSIAESEPTQSIAESEPNQSIAESEPTQSIAESEPTQSIAESEPNQSIAESEPNQSIAESEPTQSIVESESAQLDPRKINSYLKFINALCSQNNIKLDPRGMAKIIAIESERCELKISEKTAKGIIDEVIEIAK